MADKEAIRKDAELVVDVCMSVEADDVVTITRMRRTSWPRSASTAAPGR
jgi:hypothetical protein